MSVLTWNRQERDSVGKVDVVMPIIMVGGERFLEVDIISVTLELFKNFQRWHARD